MKRTGLVIIVIVVVGLLYWLVWLPRHRAKTETTTAHPPATQPSQPIEEPTSDGITLFEQGKYNDAIKQLEKEIAQHKIEDMARHFSYIAQGYERLGKQDKATGTWQKIIKEYNRSPYCGDAYYALGKSSPDKAKRIEYFEKAVLNYPASGGAKEASLELGDNYLTSNLSDKEFKARHCFSLALKGNISKEKAKQLKQILTELNKKLVFSKIATPDSEIYIVKPGDTITTISKKYKVEAGGEGVLGQIRRINQLKSDRIYPDDKLKIITGKFNVEINKTDLVLTLYLNGDFVKEYPIAIGKPGSDTPAGISYITGKLANPPWTMTHEDGRKEVIPYGDPRNILGTRWMGLKDARRIGIHGTTQPESIGQKVTDGCVRLVNEAVEELYDLVPDESEVLIFE